LLPRYARKKLSLFENPMLWASSKVKLDQARLQLKLQRTATEHPIRKELLTHVASSSAPTRSAAKYNATAALLKSVGLDIGAARIFPVKKGTVTRMMKRATTKLLAKQTDKLRDLLPIPPSKPGDGRGSASLYGELARPVHRSGILAYDEASHLQAIKNLSLRKVIRRLRTGQIQSATQLRKWQPRHSVQCSCAGAPVQDSEHLLLECPSTQHHRQAILDSLGVRASQNSELKAFIEGYPMRSVLLSTLGAPPPGPWDAFDGHTHRAVMDLAAPMWAREFADHL
jgi:hypothetical protein